MFLIRYFRIDNIDVYSSINSEQIFLSDSLLAQHFRQSLVGSIIVNLELIHVQH